LLASTSSAKGAVRISTPSSDIQPEMLNQTIKITTSLEVLNDHHHNTTSTSSARKPDLNCNENNIVLNGSNSSSI
jgi:hypothetical protein